MCQNSFLERGEQIERCLEHGMPEKIVKSVMYTLKKRAKQNAENIKSESKEVLNETETISHNGTLVSQTKTTESIIETITQKATETEQMSQEQPKEFVAETATSKRSDAAIQNTNKLNIPKMCGRFRQQNATQNKMKDGNVQPQNDILSVGTAYTKQLFEHLSRQTNQFKQSKIYRLLTQTTQPAHFIAICILSVVLLTIWPDLTDSTATAQPKGNNTLAAIAYLGAFATHFGAQIWMTFVSGLSLYFSLPRHTFGQCQQILFPKYFAFNAMLSIVQLIVFVKCFMLTWTLAITVQFVTRVLNPIIELTVRLYLAPPMLRLMHEKYRIENAVGSGQEVGSILQGDLTQCPHYQRIHKAFRRLHMTVAIGNMTILLSTCLQLYFLASKIQIDVS